MFPRKCVPRNKMQAFPLAFCKRTCYHDNEDVTADASCSMMTGDRIKKMCSVTDGIMTPVWGITSSKLLDYTK